MAESSHSHAKRRRTSASETNKYPVIAGYRISTYAAPGRVLTMSEQKMIYLAWKKSGSPHNPLCYICRKPGSMLDCGSCCRSYHQTCVPKQLERQRSFYCEACTKRGWHTHPPSFEDGRSSHSHQQAANKTVQTITAKPEEKELARETFDGVEKEDNKSDTSDHPSTRLEPNKFLQEDTDSSGHGDVIRSLQSLRERVTILEKENEAMRLSSKSKNPRKREFSA